MLIPIRTINYNRGCGDSVDGSIAIKDVVHYHREEFGTDFDDVLTTFSVPPEAVTKEEDFYYIALDRLSQEVLAGFRAEKKRIKEIRFQEHEARSPLKIKR